MLTCSHTLSSPSISRNLYIESSLVFWLSGSMPDWSFLVLFFPLLSLSEMYWGLGVRVRFLQKMPLLHLHDAHKGRHYSTRFGSLRSQSHHHSDERSDVCIRL